MPGEIINTKKKSIVRHILLIILGLVLGLNLYLANARGVVGNQMPMPFGTGAAVVMSGSMEPTLSKGDLIFVRKAETFHTGDIVVYQSDSLLVVHRIVSLYGSTVVTQGDANNAADEPIDLSQVKGVVRFHIPFVGTILELVKTPAGTLLILLLAFALVELSFRRQKEQDDQDMEQVKAEIRRLKGELHEDHEDHENSEDNK